MGSTKRSGSVNTEGSSSGGIASGQRATLAAAIARYSSMAMAGLVKADSCDTVEAESLMATTATETTVVATAVGGAVVFVVVVVGVCTVVKLSPVVVDEAIMVWFGAEGAVAVEIVVGVWTVDWFSTVVVDDTIVVLFVTGAAVVVIVAEDEDDCGSVAVELDVDGGASVVTAFAGTRGIATHASGGSEGPGKRNRTGKMSRPTAPPAVKLDRSSVSEWCRTASFAAVASRDESTEARRNTDAVSAATVDAAVPARRHAGTEDDVGYVAFVIFTLVTLTADNMSHVAPKGTSHMTTPPQRRMRRDAATRPMSRPTLLSVLTARTAVRKPAEDVATTVLSTAAIVEFAFKVNTMSPPKKPLLMPSAVTAEPCTDAAVTLLPNAVTVVIDAEKMMSPLKPQVVTPSTVTQTSCVIRADTVVFTAAMVVVAPFVKLMFPL
jgi:hypothetical protein